MRVVDLSVQFQTQTDGAVCIRETEDGDDIWIPKTQCELEPGFENPSRGDIIGITVEEGVAKEKGLV